MSIRGEVAGCPQPLEFRPEPDEMRIGRLHEMHMRQGQPVVYPSA